MCRNVVSVKGEQVVAFASRYSVDDAVPIHSSESISCGDEQVFLVVEVDTADTAQGRLRCRNAVYARISATDESAVTGEGGDDASDGIDLAHLVFRSFGDIHIAIFIEGDVFGTAQLRVCCQDTIAGIAPATRYGGDDAGYFVDFADTAVAGISNIHIAFFIELHALRTFKLGGRCRASIAGESLRPGATGYGKNQSCTGFDFADHIIGPEPYTDKIDIVVMIDRNMMGFAHSLPDCRNTAGIGIAARPTTGGPGKKMSRGQVHY